MNAVSCKANFSHFIARSNGTALSCTHTILCIVAVNYGLSQSITNRYSTAIICKMALGPNDP